MLVNASKRILIGRSSSHRVAPRQLRLAVSAVVAGALLAGCGSGGGSDQPEAGCLPLNQMAAIVSEAESEFAAGSRTLGDQLEGFDKMQPLIDQIVTECDEGAFEEGMGLGARYGAITNALSGS